MNGQVPMFVGLRASVEVMELKAWYGQVTERLARFLSAVRILHIKGS